MQVETKTNDTRNQKQRPLYMHRVAVTPSARAKYTVRLICRETRRVDKESDSTSFVSSRWSRQINSIDKTAFDNNRKQQK